MNIFLESKSLWKPCILLNLGSLVLIFGANTIFGQVSEQDFEISKIQTENELLDDQIRNRVSSIQNILLTHVLPIIGAIFVAFIPAYLAWRSERRKLLPAEQEEIFQNIVKVWYDTSYLDVYKKIWNDIQNSENDAYSDKLEDSYWERLCIKDFSLENFPELKGKAKDPKNVEGLISYVKRRLGYKDKEEMEIRQRIEYIQNIAEVEYHDTVRTVLPEIVEIAVASALGPTTIVQEKDYDELVEKSLKAVKRLMIFYRLAEDKLVVETLIRSKLTEKNLKI